MSHVPSPALLDSFAALIDLDRRTPPPTAEEQTAECSASEARARRLSHTSITKPIYLNATKAQLVVESADRSPSVESTASPVRGLASLFLVHRKGRS